MANQLAQHDPPHCIWMDAGVVGYKLCDRDFQCDHCPFDGTMHRGNRSAGKPGTPRPAGVSADSMSPADNRLSILLTALGQGDFPEDRLYHHGHAWVKTLAHAVVEVGIDHMAASLLGSLASIVLPSPQSRIIHRMPWCWLIHREGALSLYSPVHGIVGTVNERLIEHPELLIQEPYDDGWLVRVQTESSVPEANTLSTASQHRARVHQEAEELRTSILHSLKKAPDIGETMHDGGQAADTLSAMLGPKLFLQIATTMFGP